MKKLTYILGAFSCFSLMFSCAKTVHAYNVYPTSFVQTNASLSTIDVEKPFHCNMPQSAQDTIITNIAISPNQFKLTSAFTSNNMPRYEVNGYSFENTPLDEALQTLVQSANIQVYAGDSHYIELNATDIFGELSQVVDELTQVGNSFYEYDDKKQILYLKKSADFILKVPTNKLLMLAVVDTLSSAGIRQVVPNWNTGDISLNLTRQQEQKVQQVLNQLLSNQSLLVADTNVYALAQSNANWTQILKQLDFKNIHILTDGLMGKIISYAPQTNDILLNILGQHQTMEKISSGVALVPNTWKTQFDIGKCATQQLFKNPLSLILKPTIDGAMVNLKTTVAAKNSELSSYNINTNIGDTIAIIGLQAPHITNTPEVIITLNLKLIRLIKEQ